MPPRQNKPTRTTSSKKPGDAGEQEGNENSVPAMVPSMLQATANSPTQGRSRAVSPETPSPLGNGPPASGLLTPVPASETYGPGNVARPESPTYAAITAGRCSPRPEAAALPAQDPKGEPVSVSGRPSVRATRREDDDAISDLHLNVEDAEPRVAEVHQAAAPPAPAVADSGLLAGPTPAEALKTVGDKGTVKATRTAPTKSKGKGKAAAKLLKKSVAGRGLPSEPAPFIEGDAVTDQGRAVSEARKRRRVVSDVEDGRVDPPHSDRLQNARSSSQNEQGQTSEQTVSLAPAPHPAAGSFVQDLELGTIRAAAPTTPPRLNRTLATPDSWSEADRDAALAAYWA
ncbi:hypothetical protein FOMPIDRAFT_1056688, partial [Fomitopsis schrenkii]